MFFIKKNEKSEKYKNIVYFVYIGTCVPWKTIETKFSKFCIFFNLDVLGLVPQILLYDVMYDIM